MRFLAMCHWDMERKQVGKVKRFLLFILTVLVMTSALSGCFYYPYYSPYYSTYHSRYYYPYGSPYYYRYYYPYDSPYYYPYYYPYRYYR